MNSFSFQHLIVGVCQYSYKRIHHLKVRLRRFQAVESENVPEKVYDIIKRDLWKKKNKAG